MGMGQLANRRIPILICKFIPSRHVIRVWGIVWGIRGQDLRCSVACNAPSSGGSSIAAGYGLSYSSVVSADLGSLHVRRMVACRMHIHASL